MRKELPPQYATTSAHGFQMPEDVLRSVFSHCLPADTEPPTLTIPPNRMAVPLVLCEVSKQWRELAISQPELWGAFSITTQKDSTRPVVQKMADLAEQWLTRRSGELPLHISLSIASGWGLVDASKIVDMGPILDVLISCIHRWEAVSLEIDGPFPNSLQSLPQTMTINPPPSLILKDFTLKTHSYIFEAHTPFLTILHSSPLLSHLTWTGFVKISDPAVLQLAGPWPNLTELVLQSMIDVAGFLEILSRCPKLISCTLRDDPDEDIWANPTSIPLPQSPVTSRTLEAFYPSVTSDRISSLFSNLTLPALRVLEFAQDYGHEQTWNHTIFTSFLTRSECHLVILHFHRIPLEGEELIDILIHVPGLLSLAVSEPWEPFGDNVLARLTYKEDDSLACLCPALKEVIFSHAFNSTDGIFAEMVESRWNTNNGCIGRLGGVCIQFRKRPKGGLGDGEEVGGHEEDLARLEILREKGLYIVAQSV